MKYAWIAEPLDYSATELCAVLDVSLSGYRAWKRAGTGERKWLTNRPMRALIRAIHAELKGAYGSPRMVKELRRRGFPASKPRVERLMREKRYPGASQAALQGDHGLETRMAGSRQPARQALRADGAESGWDLGHH